MTRDWSSTSPEARAEALSKKEVQARQGQGATTEYRAEQQATRDKSGQRLRAERLAHDRDRTDTPNPAKDKKSPTASRPAWSASGLARSSLKTGERHCSIVRSGLDEARKVVDGTRILPAHGRS